MVCMGIYIPDVHFIDSLKKNLNLIYYRRFFNAGAYLFKKKNDIRLFHIGKIRFEAEDAPSFIGRKVRDGLAKNKYAKCATIFREGKKDNLLAYGPFFELPKGDYIAGFRIKISDNNIDKAVVRIDVNNPEKKEPLIAEKSICGMEFDKPKQYRDFFLQFTHDGIGKLEFRAHYLGETDVWVDYVEVMDRNVIDKDA